MFVVYLGYNTVLFSSLFYPFKLIMCHCFVCFNPQESASTVDADFVPIDVQNPPTIGLRIANSDVTARAMQVCCLSRL